jgi:hypothetical protein
MTRLRLDLIDYQRPALPFTAATLPSDWPCSPRDPPFQYDGPLPDDEFMYPTLLIPDPPAPHEPSFVPGWDRDLLDRYIAHLSQYHPLHPYVNPTNYLPEQVDPQDTYGPLPVFRVNASAYPTRSNPHDTALHRSAARTKQPDRVVPMTYEVEVTINGRSA